MKTFRTVSFLLSFLTGCIASFSQVSSSPYTYFGQGQIEEHCFGTGMAMGGTGIAFKSGTSLNQLNPASYSGIDSARFLFELGIFAKYSSFNTRSAAETKFDANVRYLAMGFRAMPRWGMSIGLLPYSSVRYEINTTSLVDGTDVSYSRNFIGEGGINQLYWGHAVTLAENLVAGINLSYLFGKIDYSEQASFDEDINNYQLVKTLHANTFMADYGLQYSFGNRKWETVLGLTYGAAHPLSATSTYGFTTSSDTVELETDRESLQVPARIGTGISFTLRERMRAGFDYEWQESDKLHFSNRQIETRNSERFSLGLEFLPSKRAKQVFLKDLYYRLGMGYTKSYLVLDGIGLNRMAVTAGFGLPVGPNNNLVNFSFEYGRYGSMYHNLIREDYLVIHLNYSLKETWFLKRKFN
ncbi:MAG: hypothetical protein U0T82_14445 [Bacteroidales bacterium]